MTLANLYCYIVCTCEYGTRTHHCAHTNKTRGKKRTLKERSYPQGLDTVAPWTGAIWM